MAAFGVSIVFSGCGVGKLVTLGEVSPPVPRFDPPRLVAGIDSPDKNDNPTLTGDLLEIAFTSDRDGLNSDIWTAQRTSASSAFGVPQRVGAVNDPIAFESSSAISLDGLTLWFGSDRGSLTGDIDVWVSTRGARGTSWSAPVSVPALNSAARDIPRPTGLGGLVMPLSTTRDNGDVYRTWFCSRAGINAGFGTPTPVVELNFPGRSTVDGFLTDDGLSLFYSSGDALGPSDLYIARRQTTSGPFTLFQALGDLNTAADDRDPWLSPDGTRFFFASDRSGTLQIYEAAVRPP